MNIVNTGNLASHYDLAIVGAGILGVMAALHAEQQGLKVLLLESGAKANHATVRNFGQVVASGQILGYWRGLGQRSSDIYQQFAKKIALPIRQQGTFYIAGDEQEAQLLEEMAVINHQENAKSQLLSQQAVLALQPLLKKEAVINALHYPDEITIDSPDLMQCLQQHLQKNSAVDCIYGGEVKEVDGKNANFSLYLTDLRCFKAKQVLFCCGHQSTPLLQRFYHNEALQLCKLQMMSTVAQMRGGLTGNVLGGLSIRRYQAFASCPSYAQLSHSDYQQQLQQHGIHLLFKQVANGELIIGDTHEYFDIHSCSSADYHLYIDKQRLMWTEAQRILNLKDDAVAKLWLGWYVEHKEGALIKSLEPGLHCVTGLGGKGMTVGPALMQDVIAKINKDATLESFSTVLPQSMAI